MILNVHFFDPQLRHEFLQYVVVFVGVIYRTILTASIQCLQKSSGVMATPFLVTGGAWVSSCLNACTGKLRYFALSGVPHV